MECWQSFWVINDHLSLLVGYFGPIKVIRVCNMDMPWFNDDCRGTFDLKQKAHLRWTRDRSRVNWDEFFYYQKRANVVYPRMGVSLVSEAGTVWWATCPHKWWSAVFGSSPERERESVLKADLLSAHFDSKQSMDPLDLSSTCHPSHSLTTFAFRSWQVRRLLLDLDSYGGTGPLGMFPVFLKRTADVLAPRLGVHFGGSFVRVAFLLAGDCIMSSQFLKVHLPSQWPITDQFPKHLYCRRCLSVWCRFVLGGLWNAWVCFQPLS